MKASIGVAAAILGLLAAIAWTVTGSFAGNAFAEEHALPGMCNGRTDANIVLNASANGSRPEGVPKYIFNITTDQLGHPTGTLIVGQGPGRLLVEDWCRFWQHQPGSGSGSGGQCEEDAGHNPDEDMVNAHAVGLAWYNGQQVLVRTDVRDGDEGKVFRVRYRPMGGHHEAEATLLEEGGHDDGGGCEGGGWTRIPVEGWAPLTHLKVRAAE